MVYRELLHPHTSAASSRLNWHPRRFKWTRPFLRKTKSGFYSCAITFQTQSTAVTTIALCSHEHSVYILSFRQTMLTRLCHSVWPVSSGILCTSLGDAIDHEQKWTVPLRKPNKRRSVGKTVHWGAFVQPLLQWKSNKYRTFWVRVCSFKCPARNAYAPYCHLWSVRLCNIFSTLSHKLCDFIQNKKLLYVKCVFRLALQLLSEIFLIRGKIQRPLHKCVFVFM